MRLSLSLLSVSMLALTLSGCQSMGIDVDRESYVHPLHRSGALIPTAYAGQHQFGEMTTQVSGVQPEDFETVEIDSTGVSTAQPAPVAPALADDPQMSIAPDTLSYGDLVNETYFGHGSARLSAGDKKSIHSVAKNIQPSAQVTVVGHASQKVEGVSDPSQRSEVNFKMAQKRAVAVTQELGKAGVNLDNITAVSKGDLEPNAVPGERGQEAADRRVEIFMKDR